MLTLIVTLAISALFFEADVCAASYFVAPDGKGMNAGKIDRPFATLEQGRDAIRELKATDRYPTDGVIVEIRGGEYAVDRSLELNEEDLGLAESPFVYRACQGEPVSIQGGQFIDGRQMTPVTDQAGLERFISADARGNVRQVALRKLGITSHGSNHAHGFGRYRRPTAARSRF